MGIDDWCIQGVERLPKAIRDRIEMTNEKEGWSNYYEPESGKPMRPTTHFGIGWLPIIEELDRQLAAIDPNYLIHQVKEKFGGLRYYTKTNVGGSKLEEFNQLLDDAEDKSMSTCEVCGEYGYQDSKGWLIRTRCETHHGE